MKVTIDGVLYHIDGEKVCQHLAATYEKFSVNNQNIVLRNGKVIDVGKKSLLRIGLNQMFSTFIIPVLKDMFEARGIEMTIRVKHTDAIDYFMKNLLYFIGHLQKDGDFNVASFQIDNSSERRIASISAIRRETRLLPEYAEYTTNNEDATDTAQEETGGRLVRSRQNGNGQDKID